MIEVGIDEMTIVLQATDDVLDSMELEDWPKVADGITEEFLCRSGLRLALGPVVEEPRCPKGYTDAITLGFHSFYLAIAHNVRQPRMGVCVRISAQALACLVEVTSEAPYRLLARAYAPGEYSLRLSRVDLTVDYMNEGVSVTSVYRGLTSGSVAVMREQPDPRTGDVVLRRSASSLSGYAVGDAVPTFYLGSRKANVDALLRVYDKKREQEEGHGTRLHLAESLDDWVRFEASLRHSYAAQFGDAVRLAVDDAEYADLIGSVFAQRYQFYENGEVAPYTEALLNSLGARLLRLSSSSSRNGDLAASLRYVRDGSGLMPLLYKSSLIWGDGAPSALLAWLLTALDFYEPNPDCRAWLRNNQADYRRSYVGVGDFLEEV